MSEPRGSSGRGAERTADLQDRIRKLEEDRKNLEQRLDLAQQECRRIGEGARQNEERLRAILDASPIAIGWTSDSGRVEYVNRKFTDLFGYRLEDVPTVEQWSRRAYPDRKSRAEIEAGWGSLIGRAKAEGGATPPQEVVVTCRDGSSRHVKVTGAAVRNGYLAIFNDITEKKQAEALLSDSEKRYLDIYAGAVEGIYQSTPEGRFISVNPAMARICGYESPEEMVGGVDDITNQLYDDPSERELFRARIEKDDFVADYEFRLRRKDGRVVWVAMNTRCVRDDAGSLLYYEGFVKDITERKKTQDALAESEEMYQMMFDAMPVMVWFKDTKNNHLRVNRAAAEFEGVDPGHFKGRSAFELYPREQAEAFYEDDLQVITSGKPKLGIIEKHTVVGSGETRWLEVGKVPVLDAKKEIVGVIAFAADITARKTAQEKVSQTLEALRRSEERYRQIVESASDSIFRTDANGRFVYVNEVTTRITGYSRKELIGSDYRKFVRADCREAVHTVLKRQYDERTPYQYCEYAIAAKDKREVWLGQNTQLVMRGEEIVGFQAVARDITDRRKAEDALKVSEEKYRYLTENMSDVVWISDLNMVTTYISRACEKAFGFTQEEQCARRIEDKVTPESLKAAAEVLAFELQRDGREGVEPERSVMMETAYLHKNGSHVWMEVLCKFVRDAQGKPIGLHGISRNITDRKREEEALRESEERFRSLIERSPIPIAVYRGNEIFYANPGCLERLGYEGLEELKKVGVMGLVAPEYHPQIIERMAKRERGEELSAEFEAYMIRRDGSRFPFSVATTNAELSEGPVTIGFFTDLTIRKKAEDALRESENRFRMLTERSPVGISLMNADLSFVYFNPFFTEIFGYTIEDLPDKNTWFEKAYPDPSYRDWAVSSWKADVLEKRGDGKGPERVLNIRCRDGGSKTISLRTVVMESGQHLMTYEDITNRIRSEEALRKSEEKYRLLIDNARDAILIIQDGMIRFTNPRLVEILGYPEEDLYNHSIAEFVYEEDRELVMDLHFRRLSGDSTPGGATFRGVTRTGEIVWLDVTAVSVEWEGRTAGLYFLRDVSQQRLLEGQLVQAQKMEAVGTLAGGVAHDFNNILMGIQGQTFLTLMNMNPGNPDYEKLKSIEALVNSGARLTGQLLGFARVGKFETKLLNLNNLIDKSISLFGATKKDITVQKAFQETIWKVEVDEVQIEQVLLNLYINAWHAMPGGGELFLETQNIFLNDVDVNPFSVAPGRYVKMAVTDTGMGMDEKTKERIFEPFFTTKEPDKGTGLGLTSAYSIIRNHGGFITVNSWPGKGTSFNVFLPASFKEDSVRRESAHDISKGSGTILVVDDEKTNLNVTRELLERWGYSVLTAERGQDAVAIYEKEGAGIDLVLLDMIMPGMSGEKTFELLQRIDPDVRIIVCSGYSLGNQARRLMDRGCLGYIQKPYHFENFLTRISEAIKGKRND